MSSKLAVLFVLACLSAGATIIDFSSWTAADGKSTFTVNNITLTAGGAAISPKLDITSNGLGIEGGPLDPSRDEISAFEMATISFASPVTIDQIVLNLLFPNERGTGKEWGEYSVNGGSWVTFKAANADGTLTLDDRLTKVSSLAFNVPLNKVIGSDYAVRSISVSSAVPEPGTFGLLGIALTAAGLLFRKRQFGQ